jgi:hypothetical protein
VTLFVPLWAESASLFASLCADAEVGYPRPRVESGRLETSLAEIRQLDGDLR